MLECVMLILIVCCVGFWMWCTHRDYERAWECHLAALRIIKELDNKKKNNKTE